jgi:charged multivesicular body protein 7
LSAVPEPITSQDSDIASLKSLISNLNIQCTTLTTRITTLAARASASVKTGNRVSALSALRSKKLAEKNLEQRSDTLHKLEEVYTRIEHAVDQVEVVKVMDASAGVLRSLNQKVGGVENVENVIERLQEEMGKVDEVGRLLEEPLNAGAVVDESEIDDELEALEQEERREREEKEAEMTTRRLRELEKLGAGKKEAEGKQADVSASSQMEESTKRLSQMSLREERREQDAHDQKQERKIAEEV